VPQIRSSTQTLAAEVPMTPDNINDLSRRDFDTQDDDDNDDDDDNEDDETTKWRDLYLND